jgi:hypothetical protein
MSAGVLGLPAGFRLRELEYLLDPDVVKMKHGQYRPMAKAEMCPPADPGDQTVPVHSADHQRDSGKFKGIFRQTGYEHQGSYGDEAALASTLYSIVQIAKTMKWN